MSDAEVWSRVDDYVVARLVGEDPDLEAALADSAAAGLPQIAVSAPQGKLLHLLARSIGARRVLEIGTLGGYSTIWLARALPDDGRLITLEMEEKHARVARANLDRAGVGTKVDIRVGPALDTMVDLVEHRGDPFDLVFIDADKERIPAYFDLSVQLSRPGALIITDNVVRDGALAGDDPEPGDPRVSGVRAFHEMLAGRTDVESTTIQTVGSKGYDGFNLSLAKG